MNKLSSVDPSSFSNPDEIVVKSIFINWTVDFEKKTLLGWVNLQIEKLKEDATELILDSGNLSIFRIFKYQSQTELEYTLGEPVESFGSRLAIKTPNEIFDKNKCSIVIEYETSPNASALQWLTPEQTAGKKYPFMYSQCQPIHCRSIIPCQDTPSVKAKYAANVAVPFNFTALMSALKDDTDIMLTCSNVVKEGTTLFRFTQPVPIPSYLIAIAVGNLISADLCEINKTIDNKQTAVLSESNNEKIPSCRVWSEREMISSGEHCFSETSKMLDYAEQICGPYVWGRYDILLMPPSFPFGGMENPCLTFVTPTIVTPDKSLVCVIAHEIAHSWTGNLVTNKTFEHFWLNEGFTMFIERKITGKMEGEKVRQFAAINGLNDLKEAIKRMGECSPLTKLVVDLKGVHPDDAFSTCPYEKGFTFLYYLEQIVGQDQFEQFLKEYLNEFKYKSIVTDDFKSYFLNYFSKNKDLSQIDWDKWLYSSGMPLVIPEYDQSLVEPCTSLATKWIKWDGSDIGTTFSPDEFITLSSLQKQEFLAQLLLSDEFALSKVILMEELYNLNSETNSEIQFRWLRLCIKAKWFDSVPLALDFATKYGRMKFSRPLFSDCYNWELSRDKAIEKFKAHRKEMMHVTASMIDKDLHLSE